MDSILAGSLYGGGIGILMGLIDYYGEELCNPNPDLKQKETIYYIKVTRHAIFGMLVGGLYTRLLAKR